MLCNIKWSNTILPNMTILNPPSVSWFMEPLESSGLKKINQKMVQPMCTCSTFIEEINGICYFCTVAIGISARFIFILSEYKFIDVRSLDLKWNSDFSTFIQNSNKVLGGKERRIWSPTSISYIFYFLVNIL